MWCLIVGPAGEPGAVGPPGPAGETGAIGMLHDSYDHE